MKKTEAGIAKAGHINRAALNGAGANGEAADWQTQATTQWSEMLERSGQTYAKIFTAWRDEMAGFTEKRVQTNLDLMHDIQDCRNWADLVELQQNWLKQTIDHYADQNGRMMDLCREATEAEAIKATPAPKAEIKTEAKPESRQEQKPEIRRAA